MIRRRARGLAAGGAALAVAAIVGVALAPNLRADSSGASPAALKRIAQKNDRAAMEAAARMRDKSRASAAAADRLRAAEERGRAESRAMLARYEASEAGRNALAPVAQPAR